MDETIHEDTNIGELLDNLDGDGIIITDRELIAMYEEHKND